MIAQTDTLIGDIEKYWTRRAESYSEGVKYEMTHENEKNWMGVVTEQLPKDRYLNILDIGTGPGFFAIGLAKRGYRVTAVDYTQAMLNTAMENAGEYRGTINFHRMDAHSLQFPNNTFDAIVTRNLTWNLERPQDAYNDWFRVLKDGGVMLNFDAEWYSYLFNEEKAKAHIEDRQRVAKLGVTDHNAYSEGAIMEDISKKLLLSRHSRPEIDLEMLRAAGFSSVIADKTIGETVWDADEKINYSSTPLFMLRAEK